MKNTCDCLLRRTDRLSNLPDSVLHHILSFLETKYAVQTAVLSRRWRCAWKYVPALNFHSESLIDYTSFKIFVDKVLSLRYPLSLQKITLIDQGDAEDRDDSLFARVIEYGFSHDAQHLLVNLSNDVSWEFGLEYSFSELLDNACSGSLETLTLHTVIIDAEFESYDFRLLTKLELFDCMFRSDDQYIVDPFSEFPCLEHLHLYKPSPDDGLVDDKIFRISGLRLVSLKIEGIFLMNLEIDAPKLKRFYLFGDSVEFEVLNLPSLDYAEIWVGNGDFTDEERIEYAKHGLMPLLHGLSNVATLKLGSLTLKELSCIPEFLKEQSSPFTRLESLVLGTDNVPDAVIDYFVKGCSSGTKPVVEFENR
ncbi:Putative F-box/FBD/LRR-repeat protein At1g78760 [Linum grandiflorum]